MSLIKHTGNIHDLEVGEAILLSAAQAKIYKSQAKAYKKTHPLRTYRIRRITAQDFYCKRDS